jgi:hypothetical protein
MLSGGSLMKVALSLYHLSWRLVGCFLGGEVYRGKQGDAQGIVEYSAQRVGHVVARV